jgi:hypothetical protein
MDVVLAGTHHTIGALRHSVQRNSGGVSGEALLIDSPNT